MLETVFYYLWGGLAITWMLLIFAALFYKTIYTWIPKMYCDNEEYHMAKSYNVLIKKKNKFKEHYNDFLNDLKNVMKIYEEKALNRWFFIWHIVLAFEADDNGPISWSALEEVPVQSFRYTGDQADDMNKLYFFSSGKRYLFYSYPNESKTDTLKFTVSEDNGNINLSPE